LQENTAHSALKCHTRASNQTTAMQIYEVFGAICLAFWAVGLVAGLVAQHYRILGSPNYYRRPPKDSELTDRGKLAFRVCRVCKAGALLFMALTGLAYWAKTNGW
jgi:hypothetical protein